MPHLRFEHPTAMDELISAAGQEDAGEQLDLLSPAEYVENQEPELLSALGTTALIRAQEWLHVAYTCEAALIEQGHLEKTRKRKIDLGLAMPALVALEAGRAAS